MDWGPVLGSMLGMQLTLKKKKILCTNGNSLGPVSFSTTDLLTYRVRIGRSPRRHSKKVELGLAAYPLQDNDLPLITLFSVVSLNSDLHSYLQDEISDILQG